MQNYFDQNTKLGVLAGIVCGMGRYILLQAQTQGFGISLLKAAFTALVCGLAAVAGKEMWGILKKVRITISIKKKKSA